MLPVITGTAEVELLASLGIASWDVTPDTYVPPQGAARLPAGVSSACSNCPQRPGHWYAGHLVIGLTRPSRFAVLAGTESLDYNQHRDDPAKRSCKGGPTPTGSQGPAVG